MIKYFYNMYTYKYTEKYWDGEMRKEKIKCKWNTEEENVTLFWDNQGKFPEGDST